LEEMCIWKVAQEDRRCEFCSYYGECEAHEASPPVDVVGAIYCEAMGGIIARDVRDKTRERNVVWARYMVFWQLTKDGFSLTEVGDFMGFDHTTVLHGRNQIETMLEMPKMYPTEARIWEKFQKSIELCGKKFKTGGGSQ